MAGEEKMSCRHARVRSLEGAHKRPLARSAHARERVVLGGNASASVDGADVAADVADGGEGGVFGVY